MVIEVVFWFLWLLVVVEVFVNILILLICFLLLLLWEGFVWELGLDKVKSKFFDLGFEVEIDLVGFFWRRGRLKICLLEKIMGLGELFKFRIGFGEISV